MKDYTNILLNRDISSNVTDVTDPGKRFKRGLLGMSSVLT